MFLVELHYRSRKISKLKPRDLKTKKLKIQKKTKKRNVKHCIIENSERERRAYVTEAISEPTTTGFSKMRRKVSTNRFYKL